jgi:hypothetical protein
MTGESRFLRGSMKAIALSTTFIIALALCDTIVSDALPLASILFGVACLLVVIVAAIAVELEM